MVAVFRSWWQQIKQHRAAIGVTAIILVVVIGFIIIGYRFKWTGFNGYNQMTIAYTISGTNAGTVVRTEVSQPGKTLWDWMQLLFIPVVLAVAGFWFNHRERKAAELRAEAEREIEQQRAKADREISFDNQREAALKEYIDKMSELLLHEKLRESKPEDEVRKIARVLTLTVLPRLDGKRKGSVLQFLHESDLIDKSKSIIDLQGADLNQAYLYEADLRQAKLSGANLKQADCTSAKLNQADFTSADLSQAFMNLANFTSADLSQAYLYRADFTSAKLISTNLSQAYLFEADLSGADLSGADLSGANLRGANLIGATITTEQLDQVKSYKHAKLPSGLKHP